MRENIRKKGTRIVAVDDQHYIRVGQVDHWQEDILTMQRADQEDAASALFFERFGHQKAGIYLWAETGISLRLTFKHGNRAGNWHQLQVDRGIVLTTVMFE